MPRPEPFEQPRPPEGPPPDPEENPGAVADAALAAIRMQPGIEASELAVLLCLSFDEIERPLAALLAAGHVRQEGERETARYFDV
jgi:hypothetical protein